ncbi:TlpA disulfide reductase family protein [Sphingobacterium sp. JUb56]|uniref:TlpA family protein disulfide reductase n=1 Tax=Sphingobacterium sp. JUb56 TaxID=2587145 RepID=UPI001617453A|nr:TlpA disulfide reductase family protein [Sphingobacterium sp. JUb56]MBB2950636.1 thiol-disulfide isomerase/thioredoxin [Sphingobacterium sp. JUb56]
MKRIIKNLKITIVYFFLFLLSSEIYALPLDSVHITGKLSKNFEKGTRLRVRVMENYAHPWWMAYTKSYDIQIDESGSFALSFLPDKELFYCMFYLQNKNNKMLDFGNISGAAPTWLLSSGDDIIMDISHDNMSFRGKGAGRLTSQYLANLSPIYAKNNLIAVERLVGLKKYREALNLRISGIEDNLRINLGIIDAYRNEINNDSVYQILRYDCIGRAYGGMVKIFQENRFLGYNYDLFKNSFNNLKLRIDDSFVGIAAFSWNYINYLFEKEYTRNLYLDTHGEMNKKFDYAKMMDLILTSPKGEVRDNLLLTSFMNLLNKKPEVFNLVSRIDNELKTKNARILFTTWKDNNGTKKPAYPFVLPDPEGKIHTLSDFKGKILIIDFWYNGCFGCMNLNTAMTPIVEKYKNNSKIQFLSINVDKSKAGWIKGLESGNYTHSNQVFLSTFGTSAYDNEMFKFYNYMSLPRLLVIDDKGRTIMSNAPDPRWDGGERLTSLINSLL